MFVGGTLHDVAHAVAAGQAISIDAGNTAVIVFAYALVALCVVAYFAFFRNRDTGTNADEKLSGDYPV